MIEYKKVFELLTSYIFITLFIVGILTFYLFYHKKKYLRERENRLLQLQQKEDALREAKKHIRAVPLIDPEKLNSLKNSKITTPDDWTSFKKKYDTVFENYLYRLRKKTDSITPAEERLVLLANLQLNYREIGDMLGISSDAVRVTWHRMRKKMDIDPKIALNEYAGSI